MYVILINIIKPLEMVLRPYDSAQVSPVSVVL